MSKTASAWLGSRPTPTGPTAWVDDGRGAPVVHYQPIYNLRDRRIVSIEALVRWRRPDGTILGAPAALAMADSEEACIALDAYVLRQACTDMTELVPRFGRDGLHGLNVNLTPASLVHPRLHILILDTLQQTGLAPHLLRLEIPETAVFTDLARATETLDAITNWGVSLTLDDVGVEGIGLRYLHRLTISGVKIDRSFINRMLSGASDLAVVRLLVDVCAGLDIRLTAEGVERCGQIDVARSLGVLAVQGYHLSRPLPLDRLIALLDDFPHGGAGSICPHCFTGDAPWGDAARDRAARDPVRSSGIPAPARGRDRSRRADVT